jgi:hypothetical protein
MAVVSECGRGLYHHQGCDKVASFSECILNNERPEPDGEEGFADVRVLEGIQNALQTGSSVKLAPFARSLRIDTERQKMTPGAVSTPELVHSGNPGRGGEKKPKN